MPATKKPSLLTAVYEKDLKTAEELIADVANVCQINEDLRLLFLACDVKRANLQMVRLLVEHGAEFEATNGFGETCWMAKTGSRAVVLLQYLISVGARVNRICMWGNTGIHNRAVIGDQCSVQLLINNGAVTRLNEDEFLPIVLAACGLQTQVVQFLAEYTGTTDTPTFQRRQNQMRHTYPFDTDIADKADAYRLLGAKWPEENQDKTLDAWSTALSISEEAQQPPTFRVKRPPQCACRAVMNSVETNDGVEISEPGDAWSAVSLVAQEKVTGSELLKRLMKRDQLRCMSDFFPYFAFPASSRSVMYHSVSDIKRYPLFDMTYVLKLQQLQTDLLQRFNNEALQSNADSHTHISAHYPSTFSMPIKDGVLLMPTSLADVILGIEPGCFTKARRHQNDSDPISYNLQSEWLSLNPNTQARTKHRCSYRACIKCGQIIIQFNEAHQPHSPCFTSSMSDSTTDWVCKRCNSTLARIGNKLNATTEQSMTRAGYFYQRNSNSPTISGKITGKVNKMTSRMKICPHCGLVTEEYPLLQRLRQFSEDLFGHHHEFMYRDELTNIMSDPTTVRLQKILINLRSISQYNIDFIRDLLTQHTAIYDIASFTKLFRYGLMFVSIFSPGSWHDFNLTFDRFITLFSNVLDESKDIRIYLGLVADYLEFIVDGIETMLEIPFYEISSGIMVWWLEEGLRFISQVLSDYRFQLSSNKLPRNKNTSGSNGDIIIKEAKPSASLRHRFINQVRRLVYLDLRSCTGKSVIRYACELILSGEIPVSIFTVKLLLQLGADPNYVDNDCDTLVGHVLKSSKQREGMLQCLLKALMEGGAHLDAYKRSCDKNDQDENLRPFFEQYRICPVCNGRLTCLVATALRRTGLTSRNRSVKNLFPNKLLTFLDLH